MVVSSTTSPCCGAASASRDTTGSRILRLKPALPGGSGSRTAFLSEIRVAVFAPRDEEDRGAAAHLLLFVEERAEAGADGAGAEHEQAGDRGHRGDPVRGRA